MKNETITGGFWNSTHPRAFEGMEILVNRYPHYVSCPVCKGHGGWHLAHYPSHTDNRYFDAHCSQCFGWGYVDPSTTNATCVHKWQELTTEEAVKRGMYVGRCYRNEECVNCKTTRAVDSSD